MIRRNQLVLGNKDYETITSDICGLVETLPGPSYFLTMGAAQGLLFLFLFAQGMIVWFGMGMMGVNHPVGWGTDIITFVFWIGIGHAGTLISAVLFLFRQKWRTSIARTSEAMTVFAVMTAGTFPLLHTGRPWLAYWLLPYPNQRGPLWVNFRSPLVWDVFAVSTYATVSMVFWYIGMVPDLATIRDRAINKWRKRIYGVLSLGWRGTARNWNHYEMVYMLLCGLSTPLVLSVHSIVSFDFAVASLPGWHTTIFPPYFVAGAIFSGFAMVVTLMSIIRELVPVFKDYITMDHMEAMNKIIMTTGLMVGYAYGSEFFIAWYSGDEYEQFIFLNRAFGPYGWSYWIMVTCNVIIPQLFWFRFFRRNIPWMFVISIFVNIGMWFERFVITVTSLHRDFLPSNWGMWIPTFYDFGALFGSFGLFFTLFLLYIRLMPAVSIVEVKTVLNIGREEIAMDIIEKFIQLARPKSKRGLAGIWTDEHALVEAARKVRASGCTKFEAISPFPLHGIDEAMDIPLSFIPWVTFTFCLCGFTFGTWFTWWVAAVDWPIIIAGKPMWSLPAFVPIMFECTILFGALASVGALLFLCGLPQVDPPVIDPALSSHKFGLFIPEDDTSFNSAALEKIMRDNGAVEVKRAEF